MKEQRKKMGMTKQYTCTSNSSNLVEEVTPQILFLGNKLFVIFRMRYFKWMSIFLKSGLIVFSFVQE